MGNIFLTCRATHVALQVAIVCCPYYHLHEQQILMLQKVDAVSTFFPHENLLRAVVVMRAANNRNLQLSCKNILPVTCSVRRTHRPIFLNTFISQIAVFKKKKHMLILGLLMGIKILACL